VEERKPGSRLRIAASIAITLVNQNTQDAKNIGFMAFASLLCACWRWFICPVYSSAHARLNWQ
jgi:hypothetical protein